MAKDFKVDKSKLKDNMGRALTQSLFLEMNYNTNFAVYSLAEEDREYQGVVYPSLKRLYLQEEDLSEYQFAKKYLLGWKHWCRLKENKNLNDHFEEWKEELNIAMQSEAIKAIIDQALDGNNFQATKWLAERGWDKRGPGRPSKEETEKRDAIKVRLDEEFAKDAERLKVVK
jgi:hypothetical protein